MEVLNEFSKFEVVDLPGMNTLAFEVEESNGIFSLQKLESLNSEQEGRIKKVFSVLPTNSKNQLVVLLTLANGKAIINTGELSEDGFVKTESNVPLNYGTIYNTEGVEYKEVNYSSDLKRSFCIIDTQSGEEVKPNIYIDSISNEMKSNIKILPHRIYIVLELKSEDKGE